MPPPTYPKRLIEVDLPIKRISAHARREKSIRHGHISTLHIWWARRPLAACRAVICAALWPDPADEHCPQAFRDAAARIITEFARKIDRDLDLLENSSEEGKARWAVLAKPAVPAGRQEYPLDPTDETHQNVLRYALLDFIADFANWDNSTVPAYLETARALTQAAHEALGGEPGTRPLVVDPFAGGGSIPLEALRVGADAFASDLNPVAVLLNKVVLEYIPKYGTRLADEVRRWGQWVKEQAEKELAEFYPKDPDGATPIAYLWARTITCEGPGCGAEVPLMRSLWLAKKAVPAGRQRSRSVALRMIPPVPAGRQGPRAKRVDFEIIENAKPKDVAEGTVRRGSATCPVCGYTTPVASVRRQLKERRGGAADARLFCVVTTRHGEVGRFYRLPTDRDLEAVSKAARELERRQKAHNGPLSLVPDEPTPLGGGSGAGRAFSLRLYGIDQWCDFFTPRQALSLATLAALVRKAGERITEQHAHGFAQAIQICLALVHDRCADKFASTVVWHSGREFVDHVFARQALPINWEFAEGNPISDIGWEGGTDWVAKVLDANAEVSHAGGHSEAASATRCPLPDDSGHAFVTDPPYYDAVPYADLSDFFYVWLKRTTPGSIASFRGEQLAPKEQECIVDEVKQKDREYFEQAMQEAMCEGRRVLRPDGIGLVVFAHKTTSGWEALLQAMLEGGWTITGSWPIDTEMATRLRAKGSAALASSIHLVCRPREAPDGSVLSNAVGDWRDVLAELPKRIHEWMPRLRDENIVGADAIFACLGPALEIFSRYARVETASGEVVPLGDVTDENGKVVRRGFLSHVWEAVAREALNMVFDLPAGGQGGLDASGFEEDARLTAMWLWTLSTGNNQTAEDAEERGEEERGDDETDGKPAKLSGFVLEYDAARKIAQGLGAHLEELTSVVEIKGNKARLLPVAERTRYLFGKDNDQAPRGRKAKNRGQQRSLFEELDQIDEDSSGRGEAGTGRGSAGKMPAPQPGGTVLDRLHQSMILFAAGRSEALKRFLVEDGIGRDGRFWRLAQALSAIYPARSDEKRWVDGVLGRKKGLGL